MYRRIRKHSLFIIIVLLMAKSMPSAFAAKDNVSVTVEVIIEALSSPIETCWYKQQCFY